MATKISGQYPATKKSGHKVLTAPEMSKVPPAPPVPAPFVIVASSSSAHLTARSLKIGGEAVLTKGSYMDADVPANQPSQPTGGDVQTFAVKAMVPVTSGASRCKALGNMVARSLDSCATNVPAPAMQSAQMSGKLVGGAGFGTGGSGGDGSGGGGGGAGAAGSASSASGAGPPGTASAPAAPSTAGHPVAVLSGEVVDDALDVSLPGPVPLVWSRTYSSARAQQDGALGRGGWALCFDQWIARRQGVLCLRWQDGRDVFFEAVGPGETTFHRRERLELTRARDGGFTVLSLDDRQTRHFTPGDDGVARLTAVRDACGNEIALERRGGHLQRVTDSAGRELRILHDPRGAIARVEIWAADPVDLAEPDRGAPPPALQLWYDYRYDDDGRLVEATDALGQSARYAYDGHHRLVATTLENGTTFRYIYDEHTGRCVRTAGDDGLHTVELHANADGTEVHTSGTLLARRYVGTVDGFTLREEILDGSHAVVCEYDDDRLLLSRGNAAGETYRYAYDARGNLTRAVDPAGNVTAYQYHGDLAIRRIDSDERATTYHYDARGRLSAVHYPDGQHCDLRHDARGGVAAVYGGDGLLFGYSRDSHHNVIECTDARGATTRYRFDALGRPVERVDAAGGVTRVEFNRVGHPIRMTFPDGTTTEARYDPLGNLARFCDRAGRVTELCWGGTGVLTELCEAGGQRWHFRYDADEQLRQVVNPRAERYEYSYDAAGRVIEERTFDGRRLRYGYNLADRLTRIDLPDDGWRQIAHDPLGNVVSDRTPDGTATFERDTRGRVLKATLDERAGKVVTELERDGHGRIVADVQNGRRVEIDYDHRGLRRERRLPGGQITRYTHDALTELATVEHGGYRLTLERDVLGREVTRLLGSTAEMRLDYDAAGRLREQRVDAVTPGGRALARRGLSRDPNGRVVTVDDHRWGETRLSYDPLGQLVEAVRAGHHEVFEYDVAGSLPKPGMLTGPISWLRMRSVLSVPLSISITPEIQKVPGSCHLVSKRRSMRAPRPALRRWRSAEPVRLPGR